jgi:very-short-patch-repair endonuclease
MTPPERRLWSALKGQPEGFKFRKQHEHGPYYLDFFCFEASLAIEIDGLAHELGSNPQRDERRDTWLKSRGIRTVRVRATDVRDNLQGVVTHIVETCRERSGGQRPLHRLWRSPSPAKAGEES